MWTVFIKALMCISERKYIHLWTQCLLGNCNFKTKLLWATVQHNAEYLKIPFKHELYGYLLNIFILAYYDFLTRSSRVGRAYQWHWERYRQWAHSFLHGCGEAITLDSLVKGRLFSQFSFSSEILYNTLFGEHMLHIQMRCINLLIKHLYNAYIVWHNSFSQYIFTANL